VLQSGYTTATLTIDLRSGLRAATIDGACLPSVRRDDLAPLTLDKGRPTGLDPRVSSFSAT
jgi:hypothetical protein